MRIFVAGHNGMVGSAIVRELRRSPKIGQEIIVIPRSELDLQSQGEVDRFFIEVRPDVVYLAAARVGGIAANRAFPVQFLVENLAIQSNVIVAAAKTGCRQLCFLGSSCAYPRDCPQPMQEQMLLSGPLEPTNEGYALAKIAGIRLAQYCCKQYGMSVVCPMPCNLYGPGDSFDLATSHVLSALVKKFVDATRNNDQQVQVWGTGNARREFLHVDDLARAVVMLMDLKHGPEIVNVGSGYDITIRDLAGTISKLAGFTGRIEFDESKPDGMLRKCLDVSMFSKTGFRPLISLNDGIKQMIHIYQNSTDLAGGM